MSDYSKHAEQAQNQVKNPNKTTAEDEHIKELYDMRTLKATRRIARIMEEDKMRDSIQDEDTKERIGWKLPGGFQKKMEKYGKTKDGQSGNRALDFLTSSDPLNGIGQMIADTTSHNMMLVNNDIRHRTSSKKVRHIATSPKRGMHMSDDEAKVMAMILENEMRHGTDALDRARSKAFYKNNADRNGQVELVP